MQTRESNELCTVLDRFRDLANANQRVGKLIQGWRPVIVISPSDARDEEYLQRTLAALARGAQQPTPNFGQGLGAFGSALAHLLMRRHLAPQPSMRRETQNGN